MARRKQKTEFAGYSLKPAIEELERLFEALVGKFGKHDATRPIITIQTAGRRSAYGWFWKDSWKNGDADSLSEINLSAEHLARDAHDVIETLVHEMVHWANATDGIRDCSSGQYHNKHFKATAETVGLIVEKMPSRGWAKTSLSDELFNEIESLGVNHEAFEVCRKMAGSRKAPTKMKKWSCGCTNIRAAVEVSATCTACGEDFELEE